MPTYFGSFFPNFSSQDIFTAWAFFHFCFAFHLTDAAAHFQHDENLKAANEKFHDAIRRTVRLFMLF